MPAHLILALLGLLYVVFFGLLAYFRREGISTRFITESLILTALAVAIVWATHADINPALFVIVLYLLTMRVRLLVDLGNAAAQRKRFAVAAQIYDVTDRLRPDESGRLLLRLNRGVLALQQGHADEAITSLREVLGEAHASYLSLKSTAAGHYNLGVAYQRQGRDAQAVLEFNKVIEEWPITEYARYARIALERRKRTAAAEEPQAGQS